MTLIRKIKGKYFPCNKCRFQNSQKFPLTHIHGMQQRCKTYLPNLKAGRELGIEMLYRGFAEDVGECSDYQKLT